MGEAQPNQSLQQTLDPVAILAAAKPAPASIAAEPRRQASDDSLTVSTELTEQERRYLDEIAGESVSLRSRIIPWALEIVPGTAFFIYGVVADRLFWEIFGFLSVVYFAVWRMYGQLRGRRMLQSIHKKALATQEGADA